MNNTTLLALIILSILPASAQRAPSLDCFTKTDTAIASSQDYASRVDGLLRDIHASLQDISERAEAGQLTPEQAQRLKLAATRDMIARLDTLSAVYDVRLNDARINDTRIDRNAAVDNKTQVPESNDCASDKVQPAHNGNATVSVQELKSEGAVRLEVARRGQSTGDSNDSD